MNGFQNCSTQFPAKNTGKILENNCSATNLKIKVEESVVAGLPMERAVIQ
jgi:hypothetical protein